MRFNDKSCGKSPCGKEASGAFLISVGTRIGSITTQVPLDPVDTRILLCHALGLSRIQLITQSERMLTSDEAANFSLLLQRRIAGEPIAYIIGEREFYGLPFHVTPDVLIPRPETELLVDLALERLPVNGSMLDMGTGSGAIAVAVAHERPDAAVTAVDVSSAALAIARTNEKRNLGPNARIVFIKSNWYEGLDESVRFNLIVSNPPYIAEGDEHLSRGDLRFEPPDALTDHADGLSAVRTLASGSLPRLNPGSWLLMEHGYDQAHAVRNILIAQGYDSVQSWSDLAGIERVSGGVKSAGSR
jgi:release factor glutamine methyltransferase